MTDDRAKADCPWCGMKGTVRRHACIEDHDPSCDIRTTRDGWEADCTCDRAKAEARAKEWLGKWTWFSGDEGIIKNLADLILSVQKEEGKRWAPLVDKASENATHSEKQLQLLQKECDKAVSRLIDKNLNRDAEVKRVVREVCLNHALSDEILHRLGLEK